MNKTQILGLTGSAILFIGVFMPAISIPFAGSLNYFQIFRNLAFSILFLASASAVCAIYKVHKEIFWITGLISLGILILSFISLKFAGLGETFYLKWGWAFLVVGAALIIVAAAIKGKEKFYRPDEDLRIL